MKNFKKLIGFALVAVLSLSNATTRSQAALDWAKGAGGWVKGAVKDSGKWAGEHKAKLALAALGAAGAAGAAYGAKQYMVKKRSDKAFQEKASKFQEQFPNMVWIEPGEKTTWQDVDLPDPVKYEEEFRKKEQKAKSPARTRLKNFNRK